MTFQSFDTWAAILEHVRAEQPIYYQAPLDYRPVHVLARCGRGTLPDVVHVTPLPFGTADPFWADAGHLSRFRQQVRA